MNVENNFIKSNGKIHCPYCFNWTWLRDADKFEKSHECPEVEYLGLVRYKLQISWKKTLGLKKFLGFTIEPNSKFILREILSRDGNSVVVLLKRRDVEDSNFPDHSIWKNFVLYEIPFEIFSTLFGKR